MKSKKEKGEMDYDLKNDILFFKTKNREYKRSIELENIVLDVDCEGFISGIQIFDASKFFGVKKTVLLKVPKWTFSVNIHKGTIEMRLIFQVKERNKIIEKNPILVQHISGLPDSSLVCTA